MRYGFVAGMPQFEHHLRPVHAGLPAGDRGPFIVGKAPFVIRGNTMRLADDPASALDAEVACVASIMDLKRISESRLQTTMTGHFPVYHPRLPTVLFEHGVGYNFHGDPAAPEYKRRQGSYAGGRGREMLLGLPAVNHWVQDMNRRFYPDMPSPIIGCPKLDALTALPAPRNPRPVVCLSFHWDCKVAPETRWAWSWYEERIITLKEDADREGIEIVAHGHPREAPLFRRRFERYGIEFIPTFDEVVARADVYVNDSSSTLYEFAATGRPVVVLNAPWYRRNVHHGLRFWEHADVGLQVDTPDQLLPAILRTLEDDPRADQRAAAIAEVYPYLGASVPRTVEVLHDLATRIPKRSRRG